MAKFETTRMDKVKIQKLAQDIYDELGESGYLTSDAISVNRGFAIETIYESLRLYLEPK